MILRFWSKTLSVVALVLVLIDEVQPCSVPAILDKTGNVPKVVDAITGKDVRLTCQVKENGANTTWLKNNKTISPSDHPRMRLKMNKYLKIKRVQKDDAGFYTCVAENDCGRNAYTLQLFVESSPLNPRRNSTPEKPQFLYPTRMKSIRSTYKEGDKFKLTCEAKGVPAPVVTWYKDGKVYYGKRRTGEFRATGKYDYIIDFGEVDVIDKGNYTCIVSNVYGRLTYSYNFNVIERVRSVPYIRFIWEQEEPVYDGSNLELFCTVLTKDPNTTYRWYYLDSDVPDDMKLGNLIDQSLYERTPYHVVDSWPAWKLKLKLKNVSIADSGLYGCQAENIIGNETRQTYLNVTIRSITTSATDKQEENVSQKHENTTAGMPTVSARASRTQYPEILIGMLVGVIFLAIIAAGVCYWQVKKFRASSSTAKSRRPEIDSLRAKYEVQNEYVAVPDFNRNV